jgi:SulP family sulfate permease
MLAVVVGVMILMAYLFRLERFIVLIPSSVIQGFTLGVAFIIGLNQFNSALGLKGLQTHDTFFQNLIESLKHVGNIDIPTFSIFAVFLVLMFAFKKFTPKLPGAIILAPIGILLGYLSTNGSIAIKLQTLGTKFGVITFKLFMMPSFQFSWAMIEAGAVIALIAIIETMLSAKIADGMTKTKHHERKEMLGLALANIGAGLVGGMPATAALARTSLNVKTGANHSTSAMINSISVAIISIFLLTYFTYIPLPVIASILVYVAIQMVEMQHFLRFLKYDKSGFYVSILVAVVTIVQDPIIGILLGAAISLLIFVNRLSHGYFDLKLNTFEEGLVGATYSGTESVAPQSADVVIYSIKGKLCFINSRAHVNRFETNMDKYSTVILRLREVFFMDIDGIEALDEIIGIMEARGQKVIITNPDKNIQKLLEESSFYYKKLVKDHMVFPKTILALEHLGVKIGEVNEVNG